MENEKIVFEIDISSYLKQLEEAGKQVDTLKKKHNELAAAAAKGDAEAAKGLERVNLQLKNQEDAYKSIVRNALAFQNAQKQASNTAGLFGNSINANKALLKQLQDEYNKTARPSRSLGDSIRNLNEVLQKQQTTLEQGALRFRDVVKQNVMNISAFGVSLKDAAGKIKDMRGAFEAAGGGVRGFGAAMATTGIPPVILAVNKAIEVFSTFTPVMNFVAQATAAVGAAFRALLGGGDIWEAGKAAAANTEALQDLADTQLLFENSVEKSTGQLNRYIEQSKDATKTDGERRSLLKKAAETEEDIMKKRLSRSDREMEAKEKLFKAGAKLTEQEVKTLRYGSQEEQQVLLKKIQNRKVEQKYIDEYKQSLLDRTKLEQEAIDQRKNAVEREKQLNAEIKAEHDKQQQEEKDRRAKAAAERKAYNDNLTQLEDEFVSTERQRLEKSFDEKLKTIKGSSDREKKLREEIERDKTEALKQFDDDAAKEKEAKEKEIAKKALEDKREQTRVELELTKDSLEKREALFALSFAKEAEALREHGVEEAQIEKLRLEKLKAVQATYQAEQLAKESQHLQNVAQLEMDAVDRSTMNEYEKAEKKREILLRSMEEQLQIAKQLADADGERTQQEIDNLNKLQSEIDKTKDAIANRKVSLAESMGITAEDMEAINTGLKAAADVVSSIGDVISAVYERRMDDINATKDAEIAAIEESGASEKEKQEKKKAAECKAAMETYEIQLKQFKANKAISIVQTIIATAQAVMAQLSNPTPYVGIVLAALAAATGAVQIGLIASQKPPAPPKFAKGVIGLPGPGTETSDSIPAYLSKGESVITAKATKRFAPVLAKMEMAVGNIPNYNYTGGHFATGVIGDGGFYARESVNNVQNTNAMRDAIAQGFREAPQPVVSVQEITRVNNNVSRSVKVSEL